MFKSKMKLEKGNAPEMLFLNFHRNKSLVYRV